jgi:hypothetical protein
MAVSVQVDEPGSLPWTSMHCVRGITTLVLRQVLLGPNLSYKELS